MRIRTLRALGFAGAVVALLAQDNALVAQASAVDLDEVRRLEARVAMRDGVHLATDIYLPPGDGPFPTLYTPTPYNTRQDPDGTMQRMLAARGYAFVHQNVRGKFGSEGDFAPFLDEIPDLRDTAAWIVEQPWCNGRIGLVGNSSQSYSNQLLASTQHPALAAMVNLSGLTDTEQLFFPGGAFRLDTLYPWMQFFYLGKPIRSMAEWRRRFRHRPLADNFVWGAGLFDEMAAQAVPATRITIPTLHVTGWNDVVYRQSLVLHDAIPDGVAQRLVIGPWMHNQLGAGVTKAGDEDFGPDAALDMAALVDLIAAWMDQHLRGQEPRPQPKARVFVMNDGWRDFEQWPPAAARSVSWFLTDAPGADTPGTLTVDRPDHAGSCSFVSDPEDPVPTYGGVNSHVFPHNAGPLDQARFADRDDVLRFVSPPVDDDCVLAGPMRVVLYAASDARDTDFCGKLSVVRADGYVRVIEDGIVRARFRNGRDRPEPLEPGAIVRYEIDLGQTALRITTGERLCLDLSSSNFPKYDLNPNTGEDAFTATEFRAALQTVHWTPEHPSALHLTVLPE